MEDKNKLFESDYKFSHSDDVKPVFSIDTGLSEETVRAISKTKNEPEWMTDIRVKAFNTFMEMPTPKWGGDLSGIDYDKVNYYIKSTEENSLRNWDEIPEKIKNTFEAIGIPQAEREYLSGVTAQYDSEVVYHNTKDQWVDKGVYFTDTDTALKEKEELFKKYFTKLVPYKDNKFAALNTAFWSGGSFIYIPKGVKVDDPMQAYFRINYASLGQFERTLIIVDEEASGTYVEGCTAPIYDENSLHAAVVEIFVNKNASFRYTTIQNWSDNVYNLVTKRALTEENASMDWIDGNLGSKLTMKYPAIVLKGDNSKGNTISIALASGPQHQDAGAKMIHIGKNTGSTIVSKSISRGGGNVTYRGVVDVKKTASNSMSKIECDTIILDDLSKSDTIPYNIINNNSFTLEHEAKVSKISEEKLFYLMSRGLSEEKAVEIIVMGFIEPFTKELPMEYAIEMNRLIKFEMEGSIG